MLPVEDGWALVYFLCNLAQKTTQNAGTHGHSAQQLDDHPP